MKRFLGILALIVVLVAAYLVNRRLSAPPQLHLQQTRKEANNALPVTVSRVRPRAVRDIVDIIGVVKPMKQAVITPKIPARIMTLPVHQGDIVKANQILATLDMGDAHAQIDSAKAALQAAEAQWRKASDGLNADRTNLSAQVAQASAGLQSAQIKLNQAKLGMTMSQQSSISDMERAKATVSQAKAGVAQAKTGYAQAKDTVKRLQFLYDHGGIAKTDLDSAKTQEQMAKEGLDSAQAALAQAEAAAKPAIQSVPLREKTTQEDVSMAQLGVDQARQAMQTAQNAKKDALLVDQRNVEGALAQVRQARAGLDAVIAQMGSQYLKSPISGVVDNLNATVGDYAQPGVPLMTILSTPAVYLQTSAPARYAEGLRPGQPSRITVDTLPGKFFYGVVWKVLPFATSDNRSLTVDIKIKGSTVGLIPNISAHVQVELARDENALTIPLEALRSEGPNPYVFVVINNRAIRRYIVTGYSEGDYIQVVSGLKKDEEVIISAPASLDTGSLVHKEGG